MPRFNSGLDFLNIFYSLFLSRIELQCYISYDSFKAILDFVFYLFGTRIHNDVNLAVLKFLISIRLSSIQSAACLYPIIVGIKGLEHT